MGAEIKLDSNIQIISVPNLSNKSDVAAFERTTAQFLLDSAVLHVFDFSKTMQMDVGFYRTISIYRRSLTKNKKFLASINLKQNLVQEINKMGLDQAFNVVDNLDHAKQSAGLAGNANQPKLKFDTQILSPFVDGTINTLKVQANVPVETQKPHLKTADGDVAIAGVITMNNPEMPGSIALCFPKKVFLGIYESMVGEKHEEISADIQDAAGELLNIIYGHAKTQLKSNGHAIDLAIPVILVGEKIKMQIGEHGKTVIVPFSCSFGNFHLEVYFKKLEG